MIWVLPLHLAFTLMPILLAFCLDQQFWVRCLSCGLLNPKPYTHFENPLEIETWFGQYATINRMFQTSDVRGSFLPWCMSPHVLVNSLIIMSHSAICHSMFNFRLWAWKDALTAQNLSIKEPSLFDLFVLFVTSRSRKLVFSIILLILLESPWWVRGALQGGLVVF
jgi:hypothetical protein